MKSITEKTCTEAFQKFMAPSIAKMLSETLCRTPTSVQVIDDSDEDARYEDGASFDENGQYLPGVNASPEDKTMNMAMTEQLFLITLPAEAFWSTWMHEAVRGLTGHDDFALFKADPDDTAVKGAAEIAVAICAIRKAFPGDATGLVTKYVKENPTYSLFWNDAMKYVTDIVPDGMN